MAKINKVQEVAIAKLVPYERNAKRHCEKQVEQIANSIKEFGFISPCLTVLFNHSGLRWRCNSDPTAPFF